MLHRLIVCPHASKTARILFIASFAAIAPGVAAQDTRDSLERDYAEELPRIAPLSPEDALESFRIHPDFEMQLVAAEPLVYDPVAMAFDELGRLYVVEMRGYSERHDANIGAIRLLEDSDGDGTYESSTVFADGLAWPTAVACYDGGVFAGVPPAIWYMKDTDGDGRADVREVVFSGFGLDNVQGLLNSFNWGPDNSIHGATSGSGGRITSRLFPFDPPLSLRGRDFAFDPRTERIEATSGGAQHGLTFDDWGRKFVCHNSDHLIQVMYEDRYAARNPFYAAPNPRLSIASDGPQADVFRVSPIEPWRIVRTRLRVQGLVPGPIEGGGRPAGYFTSATGVTVYRGDAWPAEYRGSVFVGDVGGNLVHRKTLTRDGVAFRADRADAGVEFLASTDIWFRPVQFCNGPDGCLYVADMYREVIEHPDSLPPIIKKHLDLNSGFDRGRIYRIAPKGFRARSMPDLGAMSPDELVSLLDHANAWHAETAQRLLFERADDDATPALRRLASDATAKTGRVRAMYVLRSYGALTEEDVVTGLDDESAEIRRHAVRLSESFSEPSGELQRKLAKLTRDPDPEVRYQLAFTLGTWDWPGRTGALADLARRDSRDPWMRAALMTSLHAGAGEVIGRLLADAEYAAEPGGGKFLGLLARQAGIGGDAADVQACVRTLDALPQAGERTRQTLLSELFAGARESRAVADVRAMLESSPVVRAALERNIERAQTQAADAKLPAETRAQALQMLALAPAQSALGILFDVFRLDGDPEVRGAALSAIGRFDGPSVGDRLVSAWGEVPPSMQAAVLDVLFARDGWIESLLRAIEHDEFEVDALPSTYQHRLSRHANEAIRGRAAVLLAQQAPPDVQAKLAELMEVPELDGDPAAGLAIFLERCAACHRAQGYGQAVGPDLAGVRDWDTMRIVTTVVQPNAEINPQYVAYTIETHDGRSFSGILDAETATSVTVRMSGSAPTILKRDIKLVEPMEISLMPEDLVLDLDAVAVANLVAFLRQE
jgi:putative membrane-bound dehydrogenase-like protein